MTTPDNDSGYMNLMRAPDTVAVVTQAGRVGLQREGGAWTAPGIRVTVRKAGKGMRIELEAPATPVKTVEARWQGRLPADWKYLGDAWERSYGDLMWKPLSDAGRMPWYFLASNGRLTHGYGVETGPAALCAWTADASGITLDADVRCGGLGVELGSRTLNVCTVLSREGRDGESPFQAAQAFCGQMNPKPKMPKTPVYGFNDWYCNYGDTSADDVLANAALIARLSPKGMNRPFMVIDDGWQPRGGGGRGGPWDRGNEKFPSMPGLAAQIKAAGARPGIWIHPLWAQEGQPASWRLAHRPEVLDPSNPEVRAYVRETIARLSAWGYELIKHDYSTADLSGAWGRAGAAEDATWAYADRSRTTAEIILDHYRSIAEGAGRSLVIGCNTVSHLGAGVFAIQRIGDDTSGREWDRTRKMGVNTLAFRAPQHGTFYSADADCVGLTDANAIPWALNKQWMDLLARSGTPLFISIRREALTPSMEKDIAEALALAAAPQPVGEPLDWFETPRPRRWKLMGDVREYNWGE